MLFAALFFANSLSAASSIHEFTLNSIDGQPVPLAQFEGQVVLIVNVASQCGYTPQYAGLETVYEKYKDKGLVILGFPANNFKSQNAIFDAFGNFEFGATGAAAFFGLPILEAVADSLHGAQRPAVTGSRRSPMRN